MLPTPQKKHYTNTQTLIEEIPQLRHYVNKHLEFEGKDTIIRVRKKDLHKKPLMYLWDLDRSCYISSLYPTKEEDTYTLEIDRKYYKLTLANNVPMVKAV